MNQIKGIAGTVNEFQLHSVKTIASEDFRTLGDFFSKIVPHQHVDTVASQLFFKLWYSGLTITLPSQEEVQLWRERVAKAGYGQLIMDCIIHYRDDSEEDQDRTYGGAVLTYTRVTADGQLPAGYDCQLSFHT